jgi:hypothetical protein
LIMIGNMVPALRAVLDGVTNARTASEKVAA